MLTPLWDCLDDEGKKACKEIAPVGWKPPSKTFKRLIIHQEIPEYVREMKKKPNYSKEFRK